MAEWNKNNLDEHKCYLLCTDGSGIYIDRRMARSIPALRRTNAVYAEIMSGDTFYRIGVFQDDNWLIRWGGQERVLPMPDVEACYNILSEFEDSNLIELWAVFAWTRAKHTPELQFSISVDAKHDTLIEMPTLKDMLVLMDGKTFSGPKPNKLHFKCHSALIKMDIIGESEEVLTELMQHEGLNTSVLWMLGEMTE